MIRRCITFARGHWLLLICVTFVLVRLCVLATSLQLYYPEEALNGTLATDFAAGPSMPPFDYLGPSEAHEGGLLVNGFLAAVVFSLLGPSGIGLKLVWLAYSTISLALLLAVVRRGFGARAAVFTGLFAVASPAFFVYMNLTDTAVDTGALCASMVVLYATVRVLDGPRPTHWGLAVLGAACALAMSFSYHTLTVSFTCLALGVLPRSRRLLRYLPALAVGGLLGLTPWLIYNLGHDMWGIGIFFGKHVTDIPATAGPLLRLWKLLAADLPAVFGGVAGSNGSVLIGRVFLAGFLVSLPFLWAHAFARPRRARAASVLLGACPVVFLVVYALSSFHVGRGSFSEYRHFLILMPFFFVAMGVTAAWVFRPGDGTPRRRAPVVVTGALVVAVGIAGTAATVGMSTPGNCNLSGVSIYPARSWPWFAYKIGLYASGHPDQALEFVEEVTQKHVPYDYPSSDMVVRDVDGLVRFMRSMEPPLDAAFLRGVGEGMGRYAFRVVSAGRALVYAQDDPAYWAGAGLTTGITRMHALEVLRTAIEDAPDAHQESFVEGLGVGLGWHLLNDPTLLLRLEMVWYRRLPPEDPVESREYEYIPRRFLLLFGEGSAEQYAVLRGLGRGYAWHMGAEAKTVGKLQHRLEARFRIGTAPFDEGLKEGLAPP